MSLQYPFGDQRPVPGQVLDVAPGVRWLRMPLPFALDHVNLWLLRDGDAWTAVDTGLATDAIRDAWRKILDTHSISRMWVSHAHPDHLGLAAWLQAQTGAPLYMSQGDYQWAQLVREQAGPYHLSSMLDLFRRHGLAAAQLQALEERGNAFRKGVPDMPATFCRLRHGDELAVGDHHWRVIAGFGHAPEHCSFYCAEIGVLVSGDMLLPKISTNVAVMSQMPDDDPLEQFLASIQAYTELPDDTLVLPSHGFPFRGIRSRVADLQEHHRDRCDAVHRACATAQSVADLIPVVFERQFSDPHQCMFAMGEAMAHANFLVRRGSLRRFDDNGTVRYQQT